MILKEDLSDPGDPSDPKRRRALPKRKMRAMRGDGYIFHRGEDVGNAMRRAPSCMEELVKVICKDVAPLYVVKKVRTRRNSIALSYIGDLRRRRASSHLVEVIRAM